MIELIEIEQDFVNQTIQDLKGTIQREIRNNAEVQALPKHSKVAITAGSRGITNIVEILREIVNTLRDLELKPFLVPSMGSHGGATAEGQLEVLEHLGITEESMGAPIHSSMDVELIGSTGQGVRVYMDKNAYNADGIIVVNRVKIHTAFQGRVESGLSKMVAIGLGKIKGATFIHNDGALNMAEHIEEVSLVAINQSPILMGLAIIENGYDQTASIVGVAKEDWHDREAELLQLSKSMMPSLPTEDVDILLVEEMGKNFSGTGMDPNIIGRWRISGVPEPKTPRIRRIGVLDLTHQSFGNAQGIGLADFTIQSLVDKLDRKATYTNALTSTYLQRAMLPMIYSTEKDLFEIALRSLGPETDINKAKIVQIPNTLHLSRVFVSKACLEEMTSTGRKFTIKEKRTLSFDQNGKLKERISIHQQH